MVTYWRRNSRSDSVESGELERLGAGDDDDEDEGDESDRTLLLYWVLKCCLHACSSCSLLM